ncbi:MAG: phage portal protein [Oscillospiraceae bacterium]|nr:phage portal protein [Oscillospiraceae bacterium]
MRIMERVKSMIRNWLEIQPASAKGFTIREPISFETNVMRNRIWYRGDASELDQLFKALAEDAVCNARFWAAAPQDESIRKAHSGLPGIMVDTFVALVAADLDDIDFDGDEQAKGEWEQIAKENKLPELISNAIAETLVTGDGAFKLNIDTNISSSPILEYWGADSVEYVYSHGRVQEIHFLSAVGERGRILKEIYKPGDITYKLMQNDHELPLDAEESTADLQPVEFNGDFMLAVPMRFWPSSRWRGRGQSIYDRKNDAFDAHDEVISQWLDAVRSGRVQKYIPESLIPKDPKTGALQKPNSFGSHFVAIETSNKENAQDEIKTIQPEIRYEAFLASYTATLNMCLQGIMSPATLGIDVGKMSSAEAQREKKDVTGITRNAITSALEEALPKVAQIALAAQDILSGGTAGTYNATVTFGEYGAPDFDSRVQTVGSAAGSGVMSIEAQVDELWGSSKDDEWKKQEVARIRYERGITELPEPDVGTGV